MKCINMALRLELLSLRLRFRFNRLDLLNLWKGVLPFSYLAGSCQLLMCYFTFSFVL